MTGKATQLLYSLGLITVLFLGTPPKVMADELLTTWRVGDVLRYRSACHTAEDILSIGRAENPSELAQILVSEGKCFISRRPIIAILKEWIGGSYRMPEGMLASAWRLLDQFGDTEFALIRDLGGTHEALKEAS